MKHAKIKPPVKVENKSFSNNNGKQRKKKREMVKWFKKKNINVSKYQGVMKAYQYYVDRQIEIVTNLNDYNNGKWNELTKMELKKGKRDIRVIKKCL